MSAYLASTSPTTFSEIVTGPSIPLPQFINNIDTELTVTLSLCLIPNLLNSIGVNISAAEKDN